MDVISNESSMELSDLEDSLAELKNNYEPIELDFSSQENVGLSNEDKQKLHELEAELLNEVEPVSFDEFEDYELV